MLMLKISGNVLKRDRRIVEDLQFCNYTHLLVLVIALHEAVFHLHPGYYEDGGYSGSKMHQRCSIKIGKDMPPMLVLASLIQLI